MNKQTRTKIHNEMVKRATRLLTALEALEPGELPADRTELAILCGDVETGTKILRQSLDINQEYGSTFWDQQPPAGWGCACQNAPSVEGLEVSLAAAKGVAHKMIDELPYTAEDLMFISVILAGFWSVPPAALFQQLRSVHAAPEADATQPDGEASQ
jgi:hypothetical protein